MIKSNTDGQKYKTVKENDARVRSRVPNRKLDRSDFERQQAEREFGSAQGQRRRRNKSSILLAERLNLSISFVERSRFILDHATLDQEKALLAGKATLHEIWKACQRENKIQKLMSRTTPALTVGEIIVGYCSERMPTLGSTGRLTQPERDVLVELSGRLAAAGFIAELENDAVHRLCFRPKATISGGSLVAGQLGGLK